MRIGTCQTPEILGDTDAAIQVVQDLAAQAERADVDLLLFPEGFLQGYLVTEDHVQRHALDIGSPDFAAIVTRLGRIRPMLVLGTIERAAGVHYSSAVVIRSGKV